MTTVNMTRCQNCKAIMNPNWTACLVCGAGVAHPGPEMTLKEERDPGAVLAEAYRRYWNTPETAAIETFQAIHREIDLLERLVGIDEAWRTLEEAARAWHGRTGHCPFCRKRGELHFERGDKD